MRFRFFLRSLGVCFLILLFYSSSAQDETGARQIKKTTEPYISWISQYPSNVAEVKQNTIRRIYNFLIKKNKQNVVVRPVAILANSPLDFCILDQGSQTIFDIEGNKSHVLKCLKKKENYFTSLVGCCAMPGNEILFSDSRLNKIYLVSADRKKLVPVNDTLHLQQPTGVAYSAASNEIWVVETGAHRLVVLNTQGQLIRTIGSRGTDDGQFNFPTSICIDKAGDVYVVDALNFRIQIFNKNGEFISSFGEAGDVIGAMARPKGIAVDTFGHIYVVDALSNTVQIFDRSGKLLYNFGKQGHDKEEFWMPSGIFIDNRNYIYIADNYNSRIQIFQLINGG